MLGAFCWALGAGLGVLEYLGIASLAIPSGASSHDAACMESALGRSEAFQQAEGDLCGSSLLVPQLPPSILPPPVFLSISFNQP